MQSRLFRRIVTGYLVVALILILSFLVVPPADGEWKWRLAAALLVLVVGLLHAWILSGSLASAIRRVETAVGRLGRGDFRAAASGRGRGELAELSYALTTAAEELEKRFSAMANERERANAVLRSMVEGVVVVDAREHIVFYNRAFSAIFGVEEKLAQDRPLVEVVRLPEVIEQVRGVLGGQEVVPLEIEIGTTRPRSFDVAVTPVHASSGATDNETEKMEARRGVVLVMHDTSEIRRLERVRRDFVANISHEFKTPLTAIQGFAETLLGGALSDERNNRRFIEIIREHAARLGRLTDDLTKLSLIEAGQVEMDLRPVDVRVVIAGCVETVRIKADPKRIQIIVDCPDDLPSARADSIRLREILQNLLDNAVQYTPPAGRVTVQATAETGSASRRILISVSDTGIGIPQTEQARIFERFYRVDAARSREVGGTGLGLSIARHLVEAQGGRIWVESTVGAGSQFYFTVPAVE